MLQRTWLIALLVALGAGISLAAPPDQPDSRDSALAAPAAEPIPAESLDELYPVPPESPEIRTYIEIHIDDRGIRGIDESGREVILQGSSKPEYGRRRDREKSSSEEIRQRTESQEPMVDIGDIFIDYDQETNGDVIAGGNVTVDGIVNGNIVSLKTVVLGPESIVTGDIVAKRLEKDPDATLEGKFVKVDLGILFAKFLGMLSVDVGLPGPGPWIILTIFGVLFTSIFLIVFRRPVRRVQYQLTSGFLRNFLVGLLIMLAILPFFVLLCITIVAIPVAVIVYPLALLGALILGQVGAACFLGSSVGRMVRGVRSDSTYLTTFVGIATLMTSWVISGFFVLVGSEGLSVLFFIIGIIVMAVATVAGLGAVWFSRFGTRPREIDTIISNELPSQAQA